MHKLRRRVATLGLMVLAAMLMAVPAFATSHPEIGTTFQSSVQDFVTEVIGLAPYLFAGLVSVLLIRLAIRWFQRVTRSV